MTRTFGQYCGLARALELVGERWGLLVVRDLILGPKRYTQLRAGLPRIPESILSARLNELEQAGVVRRRVMPELDASVVYELTEYGEDLEEIVLRLGLWGARSLGEPRMDQVFTLDSAILSLQTLFRPEFARGRDVSFQLHYGPDIAVHALVDDGKLTVAEGRIEDPDLTLRCAGSIKPVFAGELSPADAVATGLVQTAGDVRLFQLFVDLFHIPPAPAPAKGLTTACPVGVGRSDPNSSA